jgi:hypothetical protein
MTKTTNLLIINYKNVARGHKAQQGVYKDVKVMWLQVSILQEIWNART